MNVSITLALIAAASAALLALVWLAVKHRTLAHWSFAAGLVLLAVDTAAGAWAGAVPGALTTGMAVRAWCAALLPGVWLVHSLTYSRGNHRDFLHRWRWVIAVAFGLPILLVVVGASGLYVQRTGQPSGHPLFVPLGWAGKGLQLGLLLGMLLALINLEKTFRSAVGLMRWRVKFVVLGLAVALGGRLYASSQALLFSGIQLELVVVLAGSLLIGTLLLGFSFARCGWVEIDLYPSPALLYGSLSVLLAGIYLLAVGVFAEVVARLGGDQQFPLKALFLMLAVVGLAVLLLSDRFRQQVQMFISRHLRRPSYDYRRIWNAFTARTTSRLDRTDLCREVAMLIAETFNTLSVTVWLVEPGRQRLAFGASTSLTDQAATELLGPGAETGRLIEALRQNPAPLDLDESQGGWVEVLKHCNPDYFHKGGDRVGVPLVAGGEALGFITIADRVSGRRLTPEDYDLLKCMGDQVAASLLNLQLSQKVIEAKELEAFQSMSAFFVHDLKNTASTLSLMLQTFPIHYHDPEFRADAIRGIGKSVDRINALVGRLTTLRQGLRVNAVSTDLNELVTTAAAQLNGAADVEVIRELAPLPRIVVDPEQVSKVIVNLLLNAREAIVSHGQIRIVTMPVEGFAVVTVADTGCGMTAEFINRRLFRPFQTTKSKGLGIGMYQSRMIVEAQGGRIEAESQPGRGATFRVYLPLPAVRAA